MVKRTAVLVVCFVGAALAEEAATPAAAEQPAAATEKQSEQPAPKPAQPSKVSKAIAKIVSKAKELITKITNWFAPVSSGTSRAAPNMAEKKKQTLAKIDAMKASLQAKDKSIVVPASPASKRAAALALKAAIAGVLKELEVLRNEISKK
ncbi:hypothetical protein GE061_010399 [Apolygus lucorum]|uniref:Uncharacterized protein n=1 Tax=Apolygus lucorum TaxID=248454 RepID=A0A8S9Y393_APOLU|nr:hypothetical protein GE061_010399 [Apolygus lucorum]